MTKPFAILLVARPGAGMALVAAGQSGARPPQVWQCGCGSWAHDANNVNLSLPCATLLRMGPPPLVALPLWLGGALVPEGVDRVRRVIAAQGWSARDALPSTAWCMEPAFDGALLLAREAEARGLCTLVLLDSAGRELR